MAATDEMAAIALKHRPHAACIVPEKREERTTEGGIDAAGQHNRLQSIVALGRARIRVSMFIEPDRRQLGGFQVAGRAGGGIAHRRLCQCLRREREASAGENSRGCRLWREHWAWKSMPAMA
jgi:pyridoxine 5-phosphate synthase